MRNLKIFLRRFENVAADSQLV